MMRITGILRVCPRRQGRGRASEIITRMLWSLRKLASSVCGKEGLNVRREWRDCEAESWYAFVWMTLGCKA